MIPNLKGVPAISLFQNSRSAGERAFHAIIPAEYLGLWIKGARASNIKKYGSLAKKSQAKGKIKVLIRKRVTNWGKRVVQSERAVVPPKLRRRIVF